MEARTSISVVLGYLSLDLTDVEVIGEVELNVIVIGARLDLKVPATWALRTSSEAGGLLMTVTDHGPIGQVRAGPPVDLHLLGFGGVLAVRRVP